MSISRAKGLIVGKLAIATYIQGMVFMWVCNVCSDCISDALRRTYWLHTRGDCTGLGGS